jgi:Tol biopolymer transport system component
LEKIYRQVYWGLNWSPDGNWICFKADLLDGGSEIAAVHVEGEKKGFKVILPSSALPEVNDSGTALAWGGTGSQILVSMRTKTDRQRRLYILDFAGVKPTQLLPGIPASWTGEDAAWSSDGKKVAFPACLPQQRLQGK